MHNIECLPLLFCFEFHACSSHQARRSTGGTQWDPLTLTLLHLMPALWEAEGKYWDANQFFSRLTKYLNDSNGSPISGFAIATGLSQVQFAHLFLAGFTSIMSRLIFIPILFRRCLPDWGGMCSVVPLQQIPQGCRC